MSIHSYPLYDNHTDTRAYTAVQFKYNDKYYILEQEQALRASQYVEDSSSSEPYFSTREKTKSLYEDITIYRNILEECNDGLKKYKLVGWSYQMALTSEEFLKLMQFQENKTKPVSQNEWTDHVLDVAARNKGKGVGYIESEGYVKDKPDIRFVTYEFRGKKYFQKFDLALHFLPEIASTKKQSAMVSSSSTQDKVSNIIISRIKIFDAQFKQDWLQHHVVWLHEDPLPIEKFKQLIRPKTFASQDDFLGYLNKTAGLSLPVLFIVDIGTSDDCKSNHHYTLSPGPQRKFVKSEASKSHFRYIDPLKCSDNEEGENKYSPDVQSPLTLECSASD